MKTDEAFGIFRRRRRQLRKIKCAAMIILFDRIGDALKGGWWMIEFSRNFNTEFRVTRYGVIVNRDPTIGRDELATFGQHQRIDFQRSRFDAARSSKQSSN